MRPVARAVAPLRVRIVQSLQRRLAARGHRIAHVGRDDPKMFVENQDPVSTKFSERLARSDAMGGFETPQERVLEMAAAHFIARATRLVCIGQGTGIFEEFVSVDAALEIVGVVNDPEGLAWCREHRGASNVSFVGCGLGELVEQEGDFELALALGIIDRERDFAGLLADVKRLAPRAVISSSNRAFDTRTIPGPRPMDSGLRREWTAGELYWVLRAFYRDVELYALADPCVPRLERVNLFSDLPVLFAVCAN